jgi:cytochrome c biogenesis protein CcmG, thiol:disulfide interchange protein DsbE
MSRDAKLLSAIAGAFFLAAIALIAYSQFYSRLGGPPEAVVRPANPENPVAAGKIAADFKLTDLAGRSISLSSLRGKVVFLNIWATWCAPCREEMPSIESLYEALRKDKDFVVLAVSQDTSGRKAVASYVKENDLRFTVLLDPQNEVSEAYGISGIPETFIINRDGRIVAHHLGPYNWSSPDIREALEELIAARQG